MKAFGSTADFPPFLCAPFLPAIVHVLRGDFVRLQKHAPVSLTGLLMQLIVCTSQRNVCSCCILRVTTRQPRAHSSQCNSLPGYKINRSVRDWIAFKRYNTQLNYPRCFKDDGVLMSVRACVRACVFLLCYYPRRTQADRPRLVNKALLLLKTAVLMNVTQ